MRNQPQLSDRRGGTLSSLGLTLLFLGILVLIVLVGLYLWTDMMSWGTVPKDFD